MMDANKYRVAVCLAAYNGLDWLSDQIDSILLQTGDLEINIFISVDCSIDGTEDFVDRLAEKDSRVVALPHGHHFGGAARNFFRLLRDVDFEKFDFISFADQDDLWFAEKLSHSIAKLCHENCDAYSSNVIAFWSDGRRKLVDKSQPQRRWDFLFEGAGPGCTFVIRKKLAIAVQNFITDHWEQCENIMFHDWLIYAFARANGYKWFIDSFPTMLYRQHYDNVVGANSGFNAFIKRARKVVNGWAFRQAILIVKVLDLDRNYFIFRWVGGGRLGLFWLLLHSGLCRRRMRDRFMFGAACGILVLIGIDLESKIAEY